MTTNNQIIPLKFCYDTSFTFLNNLKDLDLSCKTDLDFWNCFRRKKNCLIIEEIQYADSEWPLTVLQIRRASKRDNLGIIFHIRQLKTYVATHHWDGSNEG